MLISIPRSTPWRRSWALAWQERFPYCAGIRRTRKNPRGSVSGHGVRRIDVGRDEETIGEYIRGKRTKIGGWINCRCSESATRGWLPSASRTRRSSKRARERPTRTTALSG